MWKPAYYREISSLLRKVVSTQKKPIMRSAAVIADLVKRNGILYVLGSGHSTSVAMEAYGRAGGLVPVDIVFDKNFGKMERLEGYAKELLDQYDIPAKSALIIISNSGRNALPVEMALEAKTRGITAIAITSLAHSRSVTPRLSAGKRLFEVADIVIDNCGIPGDAIVKIPGVREKIAPTSVIAGALIMNLIMVEAIALLKKKGYDPPIFLSANIEGGDEHNDKLRKRYKGRIRGL